MIYPARFAINPTRVLLLSDGYHFMIELGADSPVGGAVVKRPAAG